MNMLQKPQAARPRHLAPSEVVKKPAVPLQAKNVKTTSPPKSSHFRVKGEFLSKKKPRCESPKLLTKKPMRKAKVDTLLKLVKPEAKNLPVKPRNFSSLLESWKQTSHVNLTSAVHITPKLSLEADSQSHKVLENPTIIKPRVSHPIGQGKLEFQPMTFDFEI
jgi:hypothetical protein